VISAVIIFWLARRIGGKDERADVLREAA